MPEQHNTPTTTQMLTTADLAARLSISEDSALRIMRSTLGVLHLGEGSRKFYRMPVNIFEAFINRKSAKAGKAGRV